MSDNKYKHRESSLQYDVQSLREDRDSIYRQYSGLLDLNVKRSLMEPKQLILQRYRWVSFKNRLPEERERVLVCLSNGAMFVFRRSGDCMTDGLRHVLISETTPEDTYWITIPKRPEKFDEKDDFI